MLEKKRWDFGDVKLMGALGLFFGAISIAEISLLAFFIGAAGSIIVLIVRAILKIKDEYVPFGPFLTLSAAICVFIPTNSVFQIFMNFCDSITKLILR